jgi:hypothetical protein
MDLPAQDPNEVNSLDAPADAAGGGSLDSSDANNDDVKATPEGGKKDDKKPKKKQGPMQKFQGLLIHVNIYLLIFIFIVVLAGVGVFVSMQRTAKELDTPTLTTQDLTNEALDQINESEVKVGDPKQTLAIESNAIFSGKVLIRDSLDVAGTIKVGGAVNLPGITVSGTSNFDQVQANRIGTSGDASIGGVLSVNNSLTVAGGATFGGPVSVPQLTVQVLQLNSNLNITQHIDAGGATPKLAKGTAVGSGGNASVSGTDTAGTVFVSTGGGTGAGCFATVTFAKNFNGTPHIAVSPVGSSAAGLNWYINRSSTNFSICTTNAAPTGQSFSFDYVAID